MMEFIFTSLALALLCLWYNAWARRRHDERQARIEGDRARADARLRLRGRLGREPTEDEVYDLLWRERPEWMRRPDDPM